jgi:hypothetical protein
MQMVPSVVRPISKYNLKGLHRSVKYKIIERKVSMAEVQQVKEKCRN